MEYSNPEARYVSSNPKSTSHYFRLLPVPAVPHLTLQEHEIKERIIVVGDVHGCYHELVELLDRCKYNPENTQVILVGDLVNKGPHSDEVIKFARKNKLLCIRGNHDHDALVYGLKIHPNSRPAYLSYLDNLEEEDIEWLKELPYTITIPSRNLSFVHAGVVPNIPLHEQNYNDLILMRNLYRVKSDGSEEKEVDDRLYGTDKNNIGDPWVNHYRGEHAGHVFFGHDARRGLQQTEHATGLDTGCAYGRCLTAVILPAREIVQVKAHRVYVDVSDKE